jgi:hypothetical protein
MTVASYIWVCLRFSMYAFDRDSDDGGLLVAILKRAI